MAPRFKHNDSDRDGDGKFKNAHAKRGGRKAGTPNRLPRGYPELILEAAAEVGSDGRGKNGLTGYLASLAVKHPQIYMQGLIKLACIEYLEERLQYLQNSAR